MRLSFHTGLPATWAPLQAVQDHLCSSYSCWSSASALLNDFPLSTALSEPCLSLHPHPILFPTSFSVIQPQDMAQLFSPLRTHFPNPLPYSKCTIARFSSACVLELRLSHLQEALHGPASVRFPWDLLLWLTHRRTKEKVV